MAGLLDDAMKLDAQFAFGDADGGFAESFEFIPYLGTARQVRGVIRRGTPIRDEQGVLRPVIRIEGIESNNTRGIDISRTDVIKGTIVIKRRPGTEETDTLEIGP